nr:MAG: nucleoprotein [Anopheles phasivirus 1]
MADQTFSSLDEVRAEMDAIGELFKDSSFITELESSITDFEYQGLNVLALANQIMKRAKAAGVVDVKKDIAAMILLFLCRGNNIDKMILRTTDKGKARIANFKTVYGLQNNVGRGGNVALTLSRVAAVFPLITIKLLAMEGLNIPRAVLLSTADFGEKFPKTMQTVIAAALFPRNGVGKDLMRALLLYLIEENKLLGQDKSGDDSMILAKIIPYARASHVSSIFPMEKRNSVCKSLSLIVGGEISANIAPAVNTFKNRFPNETIAFM